MVTTYSQPSDLFKLFDLTVNIRNMYFKNTKSYIVKKV